jgi:murein DD-endopeptidase MepM/ murein hydrolase activator NlpD
MNTTHRAPIFGNALITKALRLLLQLLPALLLAAACAMPAQSMKGIRRIAWSPETLAVGSPCVFSVALNEPASSVKGHWSGGDLTFSRAARDNTWFALAGIDVESAPGKETLSLEVVLSNGEIVKAERSIDVQPSPYKTVELTVESKFVEPDAATLARIADEKKIKDAVFARRIEKIEWQGDFIPPVHAAPTDSFGTRRVFNGKTASVHRGLDFRAGVGTPVVAANAGEVVLAQNMFYEGGFVVIDHGLQFTTMYMHLSKIQVAVGDHVVKGQRIGLSGASGRVTGPHLHMAVRWEGAYVDPSKLFRLTLPQPAAK